MLVSDFEINDQSQLTTQVDVGKNNGNESSDDQSPTRSALVVDLGELLRDQALVGHGSENSRGEVDGLGRNSQDTNNHTTVEDVADSGDSSIVDGNDKGRGSDAGATKESVIVGGDEDTDEDDAEHVDDGNSEGHELGGVGEGESGGFGLTTHDTDEDLVTDGPGRQ